MSLVNKNTGKYIKVIRDRTVIMPNSFQVSFYEFESREDRDLYFKREKEISSFLVKCDLEIIRLQKEVDDLSEGLSDDEKLPVDLKKKIDFLLNFSSEVNSIRFDWNNSSGFGTKFKSMDLLSDLGFNESWLTPLKPWEIGTVHTGNFVNQNFSYDCLYKELKKVFKEDFIDC